MNWRRYLVEWPVLFVNTWSAVYWTVLSLIGFGLLVTALLVWALAQIGIRWGW